MTKLITYKCPSCDDDFEFLHHPNTTDDPAPRFCPLCGFDTDEEPLENAVVSPAIGGSAISKSVEQVYAQMEAGSAYRAKLADDPTLKITDMQDRMRAGDVAAPPLNNVVTQQMAAQPGQWGFSPQAGLAQSQQAHTGYLPNAGLRALTGIRQQHGSSGNVTSDLPALETQMPNYRRRL